MGKNTVEVKQWLDKRYADSAPGKSIIIDLLVYGMPNLNAIAQTHDAERSGRPKSAVVPEKITKPTKKFWAIVN